MAQHSAIRATQAVCLDDDMFDCGFEAAYPIYFELNMCQMRLPLPRAGSRTTPDRQRTTHIVVPAEWWVMTYQTQLVQIKDTDNYQDNVHRYRRNGWTSRTVAESTARKMNQMFHTEDFGVRQIAGGDHGSS